MEYPYTSGGTRRRLIYHAGALGDFITALPALRLLARDAALELWTRPAHAALTAGAAFRLAAWRDAGSAVLAPWFGAGAKTADALAALAGGLEGVDDAFLFSSPDGPFAANLAAAGLRVTAHPPRPPRASHVVDYHLAAASDVAGTVPAPVERTPRLRVPARWCAPATVSPPAATVVVAPGSGSAKKNWPLASYLALAQRLRHAGLRIAWLLGPAEAALAKANSLPQLDLVWRDLALPAVAAAMAASFGYVGNDSGTSHLAAAVGTPAVVLFGPSDAAIWRPRGRQVQVLTAAAGGSAAAGEIGTIEVEAVLAACLAWFDAVPGG